MADSLKQTMRRRRGKESKGGAADQERQPRLRDRDSTAKTSELQGQDGGREAQALGVGGRGKRFKVEGRVG